ncbi:MAG: glycosyltransferase family 4 protein, partial [Thermoproteota archaeon]
ICCSQYMVSHVLWAFNLPEDKLVKIPNGVNIQDYTQKKDFDLVSFKRNFAAPDEKLVLYVGRLVYEKGIHVFINSILKVLEKVDATFVIVGNGYMKKSLSQLVESMSLSHKVRFTGFVEDETLKNLQRCADVLVVPSLFEPFGIVALEGMAANTPVVVSDTGGLSEIVEHDVTGVKVYPENSDSLAWGINKVLLDKNYAERIKKNAFQKVKQTYNWDKISQQTKSVYQSVLKEYSKSFWAQSTP